MAAPGSCSYGRGPRPQCCLSEGQSPPFPGAVSDNIAQAAAGNWVPRGLMVLRENTIHDPPSTVRLPRRASGRRGARSTLL